MDSNEPNDDDGNKPKEESFAKDLLAAIPDVPAVKEAPVVVKEQASSSSLFRVDFPVLVPKPNWKQIYNKHKRARRAMRQEAIAKKTYVWRGESTSSSSLTETSDEGEKDEEKPSASVSRDSSGKLSCSKKASRRYELEDPNEPVAGSVSGASLPPDQATEHFNLDVRPPSENDDGRDAGEEDDSPDEDELDYIYQFD